MLFICIPSFNEAPTIGVLLWRLRKVLADFPREYELVVYDDGSTDATAEVLTPYKEVVPLTVLGGARHVGYGAALDSLLRTATSRCRYPRRDAVVVMQGDFTDQPEQLPELVRRFEGGADIVVAEAEPGVASPAPVRRLRQVAPWLVRRFATVQGVTDPLGTFRVFRVSVLRDAIRAAGERPLLGGEGWWANVALLLATVPHARRVESISVSPRYDLRSRASRIKPMTDIFRLYRAGRSSRLRSPMRLAAES